MARKKGSKNKQSRRLPNNLCCWMDVLKYPNHVDSFVKRGDARQKSEIKAVLKYCRLHDPEWYEEVNGDKILKQIKGGKKWKNF